MWETISVKSAKSSFAFSGSQFLKDGLYSGKGPHIAGGNFGLGHGGIKSKLTTRTTEQNRSDDLRLYLVYH